MRVRLEREIKGRLNALDGFVDVPKGTTIIVLHDTRGYANDVYIFDNLREAFIYRTSMWIGLKQIQKA